MADGAPVVAALAAAGRAAALRGRASCKPACAGCLLAAPGALAAGGDLAAVTLAAGTLGPANSTEAVAGGDFLPPAGVAPCGPLAAEGTLPVLPIEGVLAAPGCLVPDALAAGPFLTGTALAGVRRLVLSGARTVPVTLFLTPGFFFAFAAACKPARSRGPAALPPRPVVATVGPAVFFVTGAFFAVAAFVGLAAFAGPVAFFALAALPAREGSFAGVRGAPTGRLASGPAFMGVAVCLATARPLADDRFAAPTLLVAWPTAA